ncbi:MAG: pectate lyase, partial [Melioribacteraceae bacterium]|nr:pectate lyase [Melioribacteraceae bacterium]
LKKLILQIVSIFFISSLLAALPQTSFDNEVKTTIARGIEYFHSLNSRGGYVYHYSLDGKRKWGEDIADSLTIEIQPPGTPAVGLTFLTAFNVTNETKYLEYAEETALCLVNAQNEFGGWDHTYTFESSKNKKRVSFDDNQTQSVIRFLIEIAKKVKNPDIEKGLLKSLQLLLNSQFENGAWPHYYPKQNNYHDLATFNDATINTIIQVLIAAYKVYEKPEILESIIRGGEYIILSQGPENQKGWAQQYDENNEPAWARSFEPPSYNSKVTVANINTLIEVFLITKDERFLKPIPDAFDWLEKIKMESGKYPRFLEIGTNKPLYYDRGRVKVNSLSELSLERRAVYGYEINLDTEIDTISQKYKAVIDLGVEEFQKQNQNKYLTEKQKSKLLKKTKSIVSEQDSLGRWITSNDKFRDKESGQKWNGEYLYEDRISSEVFNKNIRILSNYLLVNKN